MTLENKTSPQAKFLKDYTPPPFKVESLELLFQLFPGKTLVYAKSVFKRQNPACKDLILNGERLSLTSIAIDTIPLLSSSYEVQETTLIIKNVPDHFTLDIITEILPEENTALEGLYQSDGNYCTQCEPHGFSKITYYLDRPDVMTTFTTRIEADKELYPILLSNGNCTAQGSLDNGRHFAIWHDPFPKPCYLFALVAGTLKHIHDSFITASGRTVDLFIHVNPGNEDKCAHAMESLKRAMKWDEEKYGREYDLNVFHIVAVNDFNFGAMENKSLNIFNSKLVLASAKTATDADFLAIESVVAHEYFHNWTGNRITCRDWFQLSLKEGLTVFRDQCFSSDMNSAAAQRIDDVIALRTAQFSEDAGPTAHPIRPDHYIEMNNFYTPTVYEKGAEVIRMLHTLLGAENYRKGTDLYFTRYDGQAITCDDFVQCLQDASGINLDLFKLWYSQAGTPEVHVESHYNAAEAQYSLTLSQHIPDTPGQTHKKPMLIPIATGLLGQNGQDLIPTRVLALENATQTFTFDHIHEKPIPSLLRNFSAPVKLTSDLSAEDLLFLMAHDSDGVNRWDAGQTYFQRLILAFPQDIPVSLQKAFAQLLKSTTTDDELKAKALLPPSLNALMQYMEVIDIDRLYESHRFVMQTLGRQNLSPLRKTYQECLTSQIKDYSLSPRAMGQRRLKAVTLRYIALVDSEEGQNLAFEQYKHANNMTDKIIALSILTDIPGVACESAFADFYKTWHTDPLVLDKWFSLQALADQPNIVEKVKKLSQHSDFTFKTPNRVRALFGSFSQNNLRWFHSGDGMGYQLLMHAILTLNSINPSVAARLLTPLRQWRRYDMARQSLMKNVLQQLLSEKNLSKDVYEIVVKSLA